ncbi:MAG: YIP1 family protein [Thermodesulfobacteriota bacterium]
MGLYKVIFMGLAVAGPEEETRLLKGLQKKFNLTPERAERLLQKVPVVVKKGISKEEMEKYVKAFEEIGGRIRVEEEEEMIQEAPEISTPSEPPKRPYVGKMVTCPQCGFEQPETNECIKCGVILSKAAFEKGAAPPVGRRMKEVPPENRFVAWESGEGFISAFFKTTGDALFSPTRFFKKVGSGDGYLAALIYGLICGIIGSGGALVWQWYLFSQWFPVGRLSEIASSIYITLLVILVPFIVIFSLVFGSIVTHLCLMIVGGNKKGFQTTFRAISYAFASHLFAILPFIGSTIGGIYFLILMIIGLRESHTISTGKAVLAIFLPLIVGVGFVALAFTFFPFLFRTVGFVRGVGV